MSKYSFYEERKKVKIWRNPVFIIILFGVLLSFALWRQPEVLDTAEYVQDGIAYRIRIERQAEIKHWKGSGFLEGRSVPQPFVLGKDLVIYEKPEAGGTWQEKRRYDFEIVGPWCVAVGQMDDNPDIEVFVGAYRATRYFSECSRPYLFSWDSKQQKLLRLWTGSYFDAPIFLNASMEDINGDGKQEIRLEEREWLGDKEMKYITHYTYLRNMFQPLKVKREVME